MALNLSDSFTFSSDAFFIIVSPSAKIAAILNIGISSIIFGIIEFGTSIPTKFEDLTQNISYLFITYFFTLNNLNISSHHL